MRNNLDGCVKIFHQTKLKEQDFITVIRFKDSLTVALHCIYTDEWPKSSLFPWLLNRFIFKERIQQRHASLTNNAINQFLQEASEQQKPKTKTRPAEQLWSACSAQTHRLNLPRGVGCGACRKRREAAILRKNNTENDKWEKCRAV